MSPRIAVAFASLLFASLAGAQSESANEPENSPAEEPSVAPTLPAEVDVTVSIAPDAEPVQQQPETQPAAPDVDAPSVGAPQARLRFRSIRIYAGAALQMAPADSPDSFETLCELPCNTNVDLGVYRLNVHRADGRDYLLPTTMNIDGDARISLKYGASTGAWVGAIVAVTGILGVLIGSTVAIVGAANDNSGQTRGGLIGLGLSSLAFGAGVVTFLFSERGLRAEFVD